MERTTLPEPVTGEDRDVLDDIRRVGWSVSVSHNGGRALYAHSAGLFHTFGRPEVLVAATDGHRAGALVNLIGEAVRDGEDLHHGREWEAAAGLPIFFVSVPPDLYPWFAARDCWLYGGTAFPMLQAVLPDLSGRFPWQPRHDKSAAPGQFLLALP